MVDEEDTAWGLVQQMGLFVGSRAISKTIMAPIDRVKVLMQCESELVRQWRLDPLGFRGVVNCVRGLTEREGFRSLWRGNLVSCGSLVPTVVVQHLIGTPLQNRMFDALVGKKSEAELEKAAGAMSIAGIVSSMTSAFLMAWLLYPLDFIRFRLSCDLLANPERFALGAAPPAEGAALAPARYIYANSKEVVETTWRFRGEQRPWPFHRGFGLYVTGTVMYRFSFLTIYNTIARGFIIPQDEDPERWKEYHYNMVVNNYFAITVANLLAYPFDTIRRKMMLTVNSTATYENFVDCLQQTTKLEGSRGLFRGCGVMIGRNLVAGILTTAVGIGFYSH